jgi:hypothetical protein
MRPGGSGVRALAGLFALCFVHTPLPAFAETSPADKAAAEALFDRGLSLLRNGAYKEACAKLESSQRIDPAVGTLLYLGTCYEGLGRTASAWATFREASSLARSTGQNDRAEIARDRAEKLEPELAYLAIVVPPETRVPELSVRRAGNLVSSELYGASVPTDPGAIVVEANAPGYFPFTTTVTLAARDHRSVSLPALRARPGAVPATSKKPQESSSPAQTLTLPETDSRGPGAGRIAAYSLLGAGVIGVGIGSYFGIRAIQHNRDAKNDHGCSGDVCDDQSGVDKTERSRDAARVSNIAFAAGSALLATGVVLYLVSPRPSTKTLALGTRALPGGAGLSLRGAFE